MNTGTGTITINGAGLITLSGNNASSVFNNGGLAVITGLTIQNGRADDFNGGSAIFNAGILTISNTTISSMWADGIVSELGTNKGGFISGAELLEPRRA